MKRASDAGNIESTEEQNGTQLYHDEYFELQAADSLNRLPFSDKKMIFDRRLLRISSARTRSELVDMHQSSVICPWSSYGHIVSLQQEDESTRGHQLALNTIGFDVLVDDRSMTMRFRSQALPLGEVSLPRSSLQCKSRSGTRTVDLDPSTFLNAIRRVPFSHLLDNCENDKSQF